MTTSSVEAMAPGKNHDIVAKLGARVVGIAYCRGNPKKATYVVYDIVRGGSAVAHLVSRHTARRRLYDLIRAHQEQTP